ncbi:MAG: hypothetical protein HY901_29135 [Deltaproteobacteria bacterium]|nr:hypothetical protein [Deltaproteobacteria bacterium]
MKNLLAVLVLAPALVFAAEKGPDKGTKPPLPGVDWNAKTIRATGRGAPNLNAPSVAAARIGAEKAAEMDALRNILAVLKGIQINAEKTVGDAMAGSNEISAKLEGEAKAFKRVNTRYFSDGGVEIDVEMSIAELFAEVAPIVDAPKAAEVLQKVPATGEPKNTGLVIDASGLRPKPALAPRLLDEGGKEVYSSAVVEPTALKSNGIAGYLKSLDEARKSSRVGAKPLVIKALRVAGASDLVIANVDAERLRDPKGNVSFLGEGRVIIVAE